MGKLWFLLLCVALLPEVAEARTLLDAQIGFSADRTLVIDGRSYTGKIWTMPGKERHEQALHGLRPVFLLRSDSAVGEVVLANMKTIVQFVMPSELRLLDNPQLKKQPVGRGAVNGIAATKYAIDARVPEGHAKGTLWLSSHGIPMRLDGTFTAKAGRVSTIRWELSRIKIGPQPAALFEAPQGYSKLPPEAVAPLLGLKFKSAEPN